jgi:hypothetical protein
MNTWNLRAEILTITHRWYMILVIMLVGAALGWGSAYLLPSPYRATLDLYVGLNAYRSPYDSYAASLAGQSFRMVDDYKNWQMSQLNEVVQTDAFIQETLDRLREEDAYWDGISPKDFRDRIDLLWRNVGQWHLVVEAKDADIAAQAVETWGMVIHEKVGAAIEHSRQVVALDIQLTNLADTRVEAELRLETLGYVGDKLAAWQKDLAALPLEQTVPSRLHWDILGAVSQAVDWDPAWDRMLEGAPRIGSPVSQYLSWLGGVLSLIDSELAILPGKISILDEQFASLDTQYQVETAQSLGLASTLALELLGDEAPRVELVRPTGTLSLVGLVVGLLGWASWEFYRLSNRKTS